MPFKMLFVSSQILFSATAFACPKNVEDSFSTTKYFCNQNNEILKTERRFKKTLSLSEVKHFKNQKLIASQSFNLEGELTRDREYTYNADGTYYQLGFSKIFNLRQLTEKSLNSGDPLKENTRLSIWIFKKNETTNVFETDYVNHLSPSKNLVSKREVYEKNLYQGTYVFLYPEDPTKYKFADGFKFYNSSGNLEQFYDFKAKLPQTFSENTKFKLAVIDTGFEVQHSALYNKWAKNPIEKLDGLDNDNNGVVDDLIGWSVDDSGIFTNNINERLFVVQRPRTKFPYSHGTHTATTALKNTLKTQVYGFAGNMGDPEHLSNTNYKK